MISIEREDPHTADIVELLETHLAFAREVTPPGHVHALDLDGLAHSSVQFFAARSPDGSLLGVGALRVLDEEHGEIKSMHTAEAARGAGVGRAVVDHLLAVARAAELRRVSLETGTMDAFAPARALYRSRGFETCAPFADYTENEFSTCMTLVLGPAATP